MAISHVITIVPVLHVEGGSVPFVFRASCSCNRFRDENAWKWVALNIQEHLVTEGLTNGRGLLDRGEQQ